MKDRIVNYVKSFRWKWLILFCLFCIALAIINNIRVSDDRSVEWFGTQTVLEKPAEVQ